MHDWDSELQKSLQDTVTLANEQESLEFVVALYVDTAT
jgi:hypothetical protein